MASIRMTTIAVTAASLAFFATTGAQAANFSEQVFATGAAVGATAPDSVTFGDGSLWVAYTNNADSTGASGASTVVRYSPAGSVLGTWSIGGNVDGLKVDPAGQVWALQNNDGNAALTVINPTTSGTTSYAYGNTYTNVPNRGFDDVVFKNGQIFLSETNPAASTDPIIVQLTSGLTSPLQLSSVLTAGNITDPDSLKVSPSGDLVLTGEADQTLVWVHNVGAGQTVSYLPLLGTDGKTVSGKPDDTIFPYASGGFFYIADTGANTIYQFAATGLAADSAFIDVGNEFGSLDTTTGVVTPIFTGVSPHGADFASFADAVPEPASAGLFAVAFLAFGTLAYRRRRAS